MIAFTAYLLPEKTTADHADEREQQGKDFKILGILWNAKLTMLAECLKVAVRVG